MKLKLSVLLLFISFLSGACGGSSGSSSNNQTGSVSLSIPRTLNVRGLVVTIEEIRIEVIGDGQTLVRETFLNPIPDPDLPDVIIVPVDVPPGPDRIFQVDALTEVKGKGFRGVVTSDVIPGDDYIPVLTNFLNFSLDPSGDQVATPDPDIIEFNILQHKSDPKVDLKISLSQDIDPTTFTAIIGFDVDGDQNGGNPNLWDTFVGPDISPDSLNMDQYIKVDPNPGDYSTPIVGLFNADSSPFPGGGGAVVTAKINPDLKNLLITLDGDFAKAFVGHKGHVNALVGYSGFTASDKALDLGVIMYDLDLLLN